MMKLLIDQKGISSHFSEYFQLTMKPGGEIHLNLLNLKRNVGVREERTNYGNKKYTTNK